VGKKDIEIEIQVQVEKIDLLKKFLIGSAKLVSKNRQLDEYFTPDHRNFLDRKPVAEWLRLRNADGRYSITYKNWHYGSDNRSTHADEYNSGLESFDQLSKIFKALDIKLIAKVDKSRTSYLYKNWEISLDKVKGLGDFVEIEYKGKKSVNPVEETTRMISFLKELGCGQVTRNYVGYPYLLLFPSEKFKTDTF
jgi:adenylate cyclase class 2